MVFPWFSHFFGGAGGHSKGQLPKRRHRSRQRQVRWTGEGYVLRVRVARRKMFIDVYWFRDGKIHLSEKRNDLLMKGTCKTGWWFGCHQFGIFLFILGWFHHPNWRTHIFQRGGPTTNQLLMFIGLVILMFPRGWENIFPNKKTWYVDDVFIRWCLKRCF